MSADEKSGLEAVERTASQFRNNIQAYPSEEDLLIHAQTMTAMCIGLIEGIKGRKYADDFLAGAAADKARVIVKPQRIQ